MVNKDYNKEIIEKFIEIFKVRKLDENIILSALDSFKQNRFNIDSGSNIDQENFNKSKDAILGKVARTQIITKITKNVFKNNQTACSKYIQNPDVK